MDPHPIASIELFAGVGMLGEGLRAGLDHLGIPYRTVCYVEREAHAAANLVARMEEGSLDVAPVWSDVATFDGRRWRGKVDCVVAGFPCQDLSVAGKRAGLDGHRSGLFFEVTRIADDSGAWLIVLENVAGIASATASVVDEAEGELEERAASRVVGELADLGWNAEWIVVSAADVGANHGRARWFCVAWKDVADPARHVGDGDGDGESRRRREIFEAGDELDDTFSNRRGARRVADGEDDRNVADATGALSLPLADTSRARPRPQGIELGDARAENGRRQEAYGSTGELRGLFAPGPADPRWAGILAESPWFAPALSIEEQHAAAATFPSAQSVLRGMADGLAHGLDFDHRRERLKCCGNGVVALCAAVAVVVLLRRAGIA